MKSLDLKFPSITITSENMRRLNVLALSDTPRRNPLRVRSIGTNVVPVH